MIARSLLQSVAKDEVRVEVPSGEVLTGRLHSSLKEAGTRRALVGRTLDLSKAYRQLAVSPKDDWAKVVVVYCPSTKAPVFFLQYALPFGACAAVWAFNRCSRALWRLGSGTPPPLEQFLR